MARHIFEGAEDVLATTVLHSGQLETGRRHSVANIENIRLGDRVDVVVVDAQQPIAAVGFSQQYVVEYENCPPATAAPGRIGSFVTIFSVDCLADAVWPASSVPDATGTEVRRSSPTAPRISRCTGAPPKPRRTANTSPAIAIEAAHWARTAGGEAKWLAKAT